MVDGRELMATPEVLVAQGLVNQVEGVVMGTNLNEGRLLVPIQNPIEGAPHSTPAQLAHWVARLYPRLNHSAILALYPLASYASEGEGEVSSAAWRAATAIFTDSQYLCPTQRSARWLQSSSKVANDRVYVYRLEYAPSTQRGEAEEIYWWSYCQAWPLPCRDMYTRMGVGHGADVDLVWPVPTLNVTDREVSEAMVGYWHNFAANGDPNGAIGVVSGKAALPHWPRYGEGAATVALGPRPETRRHLRALVCQFWDRSHPVPYMYEPSRADLV